MEVPQRASIPHQNVKAGPVAKRAVANNSEVVACAGCDDDLDTSNYHLQTTLRFGAGGSRGVRYKSFVLHDTECFEA
jgi:hypothetical protein